MMSTGEGLVKGRLLAKTYWDENDEQTPNSQPPIFKTSYHHPSKHPFPSPSHQPCTYPSSQVGLRPYVEGSNFIVVHSGDALFCDIQCLQPACLYEIVVVALSAFGPSPPSVPSLVETACAPPEGTDPPFLLRSVPPFYSQL